MKEVTTVLAETLNNDIIAKHLESYKDHDGYIYGDLDIGQTIDQYVYVKNILLSSIQNGSFDKLSWAKRNNILTVYNRAVQYYTNISSLMGEIDGWCETVLSSGLLGLQVEGKDYQSEFNNLVDAQNRILALEASLAEEHEYIHAITEMYDQAVSASSSITSKENEINNQLAGVKKASDLIEGYKINSSGIVLSIKDAATDIETKKMSIEAFYNNIDEYKKQIDTTSGIVIDILGREEEIKDLIRSAENALNLKSAQGISAAFSNQYTESLKGKERWLTWAVLFLIASGAATVWILTGWGIEKPNEIASILGRIVAVGIMIAGATFCASQYQKQTSIAEDYAYKAVLSKSILAFTDEIKKRNDGQVADYITKVLSEIHKDPQRSRSTKSSASSKFNANSIVEKLIEKIPGGKE